MDDCEDDYGAGPYWSEHKPIQLYKAGGHLNAFVAALSGVDVEGAKSKAGESDDEDELDDPTILSKKDLARLATVDQKALARVVENDPTPLADLPLPLKITKAIQLLSNRATGPGRPADVVLSRGDAAKLLELLGSALGEAQSLPLSMLSLFPRKEQSKPSTESVRMQLGLPLPKQPTSPVEDDLPDPDLPLPPFAQDLRLLSLFHENTKLLAAALRPETIFDAPEKKAKAVDKPASEAAAAKLDEGKKEDQTIGPCYIQHLPDEVLSMIFAYAREAASVRHDPWANPLPVNAVGLPGPAKMTAYAVKPPTRPLCGSRPAALRFMLGLSEPALTLAPSQLAFQHLYIHHGLGLVKLNKLLAQDGVGSALAAQIISLDTLVPVTDQDDADDDAFGGLGAAGTRSRYRYGGAHRGVPRPPSGGSAAATPEDKEERDAGAQFAKLLQKATNLQTLKLKIVMAEDGFVDGALPYADFLEPPVFEALCAKPSLRDLHLRYVSDFEELETMLQNLPNLTMLKLDSIDNLAGTAPLGSSSHPASRLQVIHIGNPRASDISSLSEQQLKFLLEPCVSSGAIREIQISLVADNQGGGLGGFALALGGGGGMQAPAAPFASTAFADLLTRAGGSLERLYLQDLSLTGAVNPSLRAAPHNGTLDHALSHLSALRELSIQLDFTGANFLTSISRLPALTALSLHGLPTNLTSNAFADALESSFPALRSVFFGGGSLGSRGMGGGGGIWTGGGIRKIRQAAEQRGIKCVISRD
ncbi:hypothetical protein JCM10213_005832 [Rhodosporidiobolus nylandii]